MQLQLIHVSKRAPGHSVPEKKALHYGRTKYEMVRSELVNMMFAVALIRIRELPGRLRKHHADFTVSVIKGLIIRVPSFL